MLAGEATVTLIVLGAALVLSATMGRLVPWPSTSTPGRRLGRRTVVASYLLGVALLGAGLLERYGRSIPDLLWPPLPRVVIESPSDGATVPRLSRVTGTASGVRADHRLWLLVNPRPDPGWWPQGGPLVPSPRDGRWEGQVRLGGAKGQRFVVGVVVATEPAHRSLIEYLDRSEREGSFPGRPLPSGSVLLATRELTLGE